MEDPKGSGSSLGRPSRYAARVIRRAPLVSFFVLAFVLSWLAWTPYILSSSGLGVLAFDFPVVLGTSQLIGVIPGAFLGPIFSAFLVTRVAFGRRGVREWLSRFARWRVNWRWYLMSITAVPILLTVIGTLTAGWSAVRPPTAGLLILFLPMLALQLITTGLAEEPGWRDFALPKLQFRFGPIGANLVLGPLWGVWHLPLFLTEWGGWPNVTALDPVLFVLTAVSISFVMTWVFNRTGESLPLQMILHCSINTYATLIWPVLFPTVADHSAINRGVLLATGSAAILLIVATRGRLAFPEAFPLPRPQAVETQTSESQSPDVRV